MLNEVDQIMRPTSDFTLAALPHQFDCSIPLPLPAGLCQDLQNICKLAISKDIPFPRSTTIPSAIDQDTGMAAAIEREEEEEEGGILHQESSSVHSPIDIVRNHSLDNDPLNQNNISHSHSNIIDNSLLPPMDTNYDYNAYDEPPPFDGNMDYGGEGQTTTNIAQENYGLNMELNQLTKTLMDVSYFYY